MLDDPTAKPIHSFVAEQDDERVGHIFFTAVRIEPSDVSVQILAPLAISSDQQRSGLGTQLVNEALAELNSTGVELSSFSATPTITYLRFGFAPASARGFDAPYPILPKNADAWMVKELQPGAIENNQGTVRCCKALDQPQYWQE